jgi:DNA-binding transcriptional MerR regulator
MARLPKDEEARWRYRIKELTDEGRNHHQIAQMLEDEGYPGSTRPQNIKRIVDNLDKGAYSTGQIVSPDEQKAILVDLTSRAEDDLDKIDAQIELLAESPQENATKIEKLFKLKNEFYKNIGVLWSVSESISGSKKVPTISGDKVQVNFANMDYKRLHEAAKDATRALDKARD